jgi:Na+/H+-dicarboxylate symporter
VNVLGNCLACVVVARWEGEFRTKRGALNMASAAGSREK